MGYCCNHCGCEIEDSKDIVVSDQRITGMKPVPLCKVCAKDLSDTINDYLYVSPFPTPTPNEGEPE